MKIKALLHCKKAKNKDERLMISCKGEFKLAKDFLYITDYPKIFNSKIVAECDYEVEEIEYFDDDFGEGELYTKTLNIEELTKRSCIAINNLYEYLQNKYFQYEGYAIHIKNLHIFDKPKELSECHKKYGGINYSPTYYMPISKAPQNMMKVWVYENGEWNIYILISFDPESLCMILNGKKTIEPRATILKEMIPECI